VFLDGIVYMLVHFPFFPEYVQIHNLLVKDKKSFLQSGYFGMLHHVCESKKLNDLCVKIPAVKESSVQSRSVCGAIVFKATSGPGLQLINVM